MTGRGAARLQAPLLPLLRGAVCAAVLMLLLAGGAGVPRLARAAAAAAGVDATAATGDILQLVNSYRAEYGRAAVSPEPRLRSAAAAYAAVLASQRVLRHDADGRTPAQRAEAEHYAHCIVSENIAFEQRAPEFSSAELARALFDGWRNSPPHRHNMLDPDVTDTGIGLARDAHTGRWYAVQLFGLPASARRVFEVSNQTARPVHYQLGGASFDIGPRETRRHSACRPERLAIGTGPGALNEAPRHGAHYVVMDASGGGLRVERR